MISREGKPQPPGRSRAIATFASLFFLAAGAAACSGAHDSGATATGGRTGGDDAGLGGQAGGGGGLGGSTASGGRSATGSGGRGGAAAGGSAAGGRGGSSTNGGAGGAPPNTCLQPGVNSSCTSDCAPCPSGSLASALTCGPITEANAVCGGGHCCMHEGTGGAPGSGGRGRSGGVPVGAGGLGGQPDAGPQCPPAVPHLTVDPFTPFPCTTLDTALRCTYHADASGGDAAPCDQTFYCQCTGGGLSAQCAWQNMSFQTCP